VGLTEIHLCCRCCTCPSILPFCPTARYYPAWCEQCIEYPEIRSVSVKNTLPRQNLPSTAERSISPGWPQALGAAFTSRAPSSRCESTLATMTHDNTPHRIFKISELTRLIASQLVLISRGNAVNLACACRCLEEPALSTLWETQSALYTLLEVLPGGVLDPRPRVIDGRVVCGLRFPPEESNAQARVISVYDRGGSIARGLEQSPTIRVLDAPSPHG